VCAVSGNATHGNIIESSWGRILALVQGFPSRVAIYDIQIRPRLLLAAAPRCSVFSGQSLRQSGSVHQEGLDRASARTWTHVAHE
jgi:hypothetical protein